MTVHGAWLKRGELADLFQRASGFIHVGEEDFGISMVEALAAGVPVLAYNAGGAREIGFSSRVGGEERALARSNALHTSIFPTGRRPAEVVRLLVGRSLGLPSRSGAARPASSGAAGRPLRSSNPLGSRESGRLTRASALLMATKARPGGQGRVLQARFSEASDSPPNGEESLGLASAAPNAG